MAIIAVENLKKDFGRFQALRGLSFEVQQGEIFGFLGPNGAGKTTTIRCLLGFLRPTSGSVKIPPLGQVGYLSGDVRLNAGWTGEDHINFLEKIRGRKSEARELTRDLNFNPSVKFRALSSGNKQKLGLILALMFQPELVIMDEPTVGLDPLLQNTIYELLEKYRQNGMSIFMSSHNLAEVERLCDRVGVIKEGKLVAVERIQELKDKRMHVVKVTFGEPLTAAEFASGQVQVRKTWSDGAEFGISGDINPLIQQLSRHHVKDIEITHASLEEIFLEFYGNGTPRIEEGK